MRSGSRSSCARTSTSKSPSENRSPTLDAELVEQALAGGDAPHAVALRKDVGERRRAGIEVERAEQRKGAVDRRARRSAAPACRAGPSGRPAPPRLIASPRSSHPGALFLASPRAARARSPASPPSSMRDWSLEPAGEGCRDRSRRRDRPGAERQAGEIDPEAAEAARQFAARNAQPGREFALHHDPPVAHLDDAVGAPRDLQVVRHHHQRRVALLRDGEQHVGDHRCPRRGRDFRSARRRRRWPDCSPAPAPPPPAAVRRRKAGRDNDPCARPRPTASSPDRASRSTFGEACDLQRRAHIVERVHRAEQVEGLEHQAHPPAPQPRQSVLALPVERFVPSSVTSPLVARSIPVDDRDQRRLARARRADDGDAFARHGAEADALQDFDRPRGGRQCQVDVG